MVYKYVCTHIYIYTYIYVHMYLSVCLSVYLSTYLSIYLSIYLYDLSGTYTNVVLVVEGPVGAAGQLHPLQALKHYHMAIQCNPRFAQTLNNLGG